jgi:transcriptional regulator with XRE-family HTH domain
MTSSGSTVVLEFHNDERQDASHISGYNGCLPEREGARMQDPAWLGVSQVAGGLLLRELRRAEGMILIELAGRLKDQDVRIDASHLQRIETGRIVRPTADTLEAILTVGLGALFRTRRDVLEAFGYRFPWALPTERKIEDGRRLCAQKLRSATWPSYLMDHGQRV